MAMRARFKPYRPDGREWCCYKDDPCETHARVREALVGLAQGNASFDDTMKVIRDERLHEASRLPAPPVKALSIQQPWACAILYSTKRVENRTWPTKYRGTFAIHAGKKYDRESAVDLERQILAVPEPRPPAFCGGIIGTARLVDCVRVETLGPEHRSWAVGPWCFILDDVRAFAEPIPWKGELGFFDVPAAVVAEQMR